MQETLRVERQLPSECLRVALLAGTLGQGGAEKQLVYLARALREANVVVRVYCLTEGEHYDAKIRSLGFEPTWVGQHHSPVLRLAAISKAMRRFQPHILQSTHFYTNIYTALVARRNGIIGIGSIRNDTNLDMKANGHWGQLLSRMPRSLIANSYVAKQNARTLGLREEKMHVLQNVIDLSEFDSLIETNSEARRTNGTLVVAVGRLVPFKRLEQFVAALAKGRAQLGTLRGAIVGDGPERARLESTARAHGLSSLELSFLGRRDNVPELLKQADMLVLCSDNEGFPNVLLEAMAARLPVITTPAGDAGTVVQDGLTGFVVPCGDVNSLSKRMVILGKNSALRKQFGEAGRKRVEQEYSFEGLATKVIDVYRDIAHQQDKQRILNFLPAICHASYSGSN